MNNVDDVGTSTIAVLEESLKYLVPFLAVLDSATPFVEIVAITAVIVVLTKEVLDDDKEESQAVSASARRTSKHQEFFPENPLEFAPQGLTPKVYVERGEKNGGIIKWEIPGTKIAIFEWNEDHQYGPHYHVMHQIWKNQHLDPNHYRSGDPVPEPWNTIFFDYKKG